MKKVMRIAGAAVMVATGLYALAVLHKLAGEALPVAAKTVTAPKATATSWQQVFESPAPVTVEQLLTGTVRARSSKLFNMKHPNARGLVDEMVELPDYAYLVRHDRLGCFLIDAGLSPSTQTSSTGDVKGILKPADVSYRQERGMDLAAQLRERGVVPKGVFLTHFHYDHTSGLSGLGRDLTCYFGRNETYTNYLFLYEYDFLRGHTDLNQLDFSMVRDMAPLGPTIDVLGDGSVWAVSTPGHTAGHVSYLINGEAGPVLITGDAVITSQQLRLAVGPGDFAADLERGQATLDALGRFHEAFPKVRLAFGHEALQEGRQ